MNLKKKEGAAKVSAGECVRVGCFNTSGLYICNDLGEDVEIEHSTIGQMSSWLSNVGVEYRAPCMSTQADMNDRGIRLAMAMGPTTRSRVACRRNKGVSIPADSNFGECGSC